MSVYEPLNVDNKELRVLHLQGDGGFDAALDARLEIVSLHQVPQYEAISYCWGEVTGTETVQLNGVEFEAPASAVKVLRQFRSRDDSRTFWIDALCINQADTAERSAQVSIMDQIYARSQKCLIWLGDADEHTEPIFRCLRTISEKFYDQIYQATNGYVEAVAEDFQYDVDPASILFEHCTAQQVADFFQRPWFSRVWVQQEAVLAPKAVCRCGGMEIDWRDMYQASRWLMTELLYVQADVEAKGVYQGLEMAWLFAESKLAQKKFVQKNGIVMSALLHTNRYLEASDPRDKLYAVLGLAEKTEGSDQLLNWFVVDYTLHQFDVFKQATLISFIQERLITALEIVDQVHYETRRSSSLPTWVLQLGRAFENDTRFLFGNDHFCAPMPLDVEMIRQCVNQDRVLLKGLKMGQVSRIMTSGMFGADGDAIQGLSHFLDGSVNLLRDSGKDNFGFDLLDCITAGRNTQLLSSLNPDECNQLVTMLIDLCAAGIDAEAGIMVDASTSETLINTLPTIYNVARKVCMNRHLFVTTDGRLGLGHPSMQESDSIVALFGGRNPCILRLYDHNDVSTIDGSDKILKRRYQFVGLAYVHGLGNGKEVRARLDGREEPKVFEIW